MISLYIHIPFCESKCKYCDFASFKAEDSVKDYYMSALMKEVKLYAKVLGPKKIKSIFIGGGTPSSIDPKYIYRLMEEIFNHYDLSDLKEVTLEANPGTISREKASIYKEAKINRISLGAQSFNDDILKSIGRIHSSKDIINSIKILRSKSFENINLDLMFGLPNQTYGDVLESLRKIGDLGLEHISYYSLILEEKTPLYKEYINGEFEPMDEGLDREIYHKIAASLKNMGYRHYEISNFAKESKESVHNLAYWEIKPYIGMGISSHSNYGGKRFSNSLNIKDYVRKIGLGELPIVASENISPKEEIAEYAIMGLRKINGINKFSFKDRFKVDFDNYFRKEIEKNINKGLVVNNNNRIYLSKKGLDLSNQVELDFYKID